jgi:four helix bundle protein
MAWVGTHVDGVTRMRSDLKERTKRFALDVLQLAGTVRPDSLGWPLRGQLIRACTGVGSNYRAACRAKSRSDFIAKLTTAEEEADETAYWLELLVAAQALPLEHARPLLLEAGELTAIFVSSVKTARRNRA